jgi:hypothetical protein
MNTERELSEAELEGASGGFWVPYWLVTDGGGPEKDSPHHFGFGASPTLMTATAN